jgi:hypothetical protein
MTLEMKQLHFWNMHIQSKAIQTKALEQAIKDSVPDGVGSSHVSQGETRWTPQWKDCVWWKQTNNETTFPRKMQVCQPSPHTTCCYHASLMPRKKEIIDIPNMFIQKQVEDKEDMAGNHQDSWSPCGYPHSDCSQECLQVLCHN